MAKEFFSSIANELTIPRNVSPKFNGIYFYGTDNFYPYKLLQAYLNSPTHQSLVISAGECGDALVIGRHDDLRQGGGQSAPLDHPLDQRNSSDGVQRLARKPRGGISSGNDTDQLHRPRVDSGPILGKGRSHCTLH